MFTSTCANDDDDKTCSGLPPSTTSPQVSGAMNWKPYKPPWSEPPYFLLTSKK